MTPYIRSSLAFAALIAIMGVPSSRAATYYVATTGIDANTGTAASPFRTIQKGINVAVNGDSVLVAGGTFSENITWSGKSLALAPSGSAAPVIDGGGTGACLKLDNVPGTASIKGFTIQNGNGTITYPYGGGGVALLKSNPAVSKCLFQANRAGRGGGLYNEGSSPAVTDCTFTNNSAPWSSSLPGGGAMYNDSTSSPYVSRCTFTGNSDNSGTGGIASVGAGFTATNCLFANNGGSAITNAYNARTTVINCTFSGNGGHAVYNRNSGIDGWRTTASVHNSIAWGNGGGIYDDVRANGTSYVTHSDIQGGFPGPGNINTDPRFVGGGNYQLQTTSPCLNTGDANVNGLPSTDIEGAPRIMGSVPDMGAYELWLSSYGQLFVDKATGLDTNAGSPTAPFKTVVKAIGAASAGNSIYIKQGTYGTDKPRITKFLHLRNWLDTGAARIGQP